jgi:hypothetical protein
MRDAVRLEFIPSFRSLILEQSLQIFRQGLSWRFRMKRAVSK